MGQVPLYPAPHGSGPTFPSFPRPHAWVEPAAKAPKLPSPPSVLSPEWRPKEGCVPGPNEDAAGHPGGGIPSR